MPVTSFVLTVTAAGTLRRLNEGLLLPYAAKKRKINLGLCMLSTTSVLSRL